MTAVEDRAPLRYTVVITPIRDEPGFEGWYYAYIPALELTTHGQSIDEALAAARELARAWVGARRASGEAVPREGERVVAQVEVDDALHAA